MNRRSIDTEAAYLTSVVSACAGGCAVWLATHLWGVPSTEMSHSASAALLTAFMVTLVFGTVGFIEQESSRA